MDHWKGLSTVFNSWIFCLKIITRWWAMVHFVTDRPIFHKIFKIICDHKSKTIKCMWSKVGMGGEPHRYYKHTQVSSKSERWPKIPGWFDTEWPTSKISVFMSPSGMQDPNTATFLHSLESMNIILLMKSAIERIQDGTCNNSRCHYLPMLEWICNCYKLIHWY